MKRAALRNVSTGPGGMALRRLTSLVDAAGEALGLTEDPLNTIVGEVSAIINEYAPGSLLNPTNQSSL